MAQIKTRGVVIKAQDYKENDKLLWIYTPSEGKISAIARGAKKNTNKLFSSTLPLCFGEYILYKGRGMYLVNEGRIISSFQGLMDDFEKLTYSTYFCELIDISQIDNEPNPELFKIFVSALYFMNTNALDNEMLARAFELKLLKFSGYGMELDKCAICKRDLKTSDYISLAYLGGVCDRCNKDRGIRISKGSYSALRFLYNTTLDKIYRLNISGDSRKDLYRVISYIIENTCSKKPKSLEILNMFKEDIKNE